MKQSKPLSKISAVIASILSASNALPSYSQENSDGFALEEVVVTARRVEESLQNSPVAITAITGSMLEEKGVEQITAVANIAPNVNFSFGGTTSGSDSAAVIFIRGVGQNDFTLVTDPGVGLYVDDVYYSRTIGSVLDVFDLQRIEVLRGPQGTLFGRNSTGGAISLTSRDPSGEFAGSVKGTIGDQGRRELLASIDVPLSDTFGFIVSALTRERDGIASDASGRDLGDDNMTGTRIKAVWKPTDSLSFKVSADYVDENEGSAAEVPLLRSADGSVDDATVTNFTPVFATQGPSINDQKAMGISLSAEWLINEDTSIKSITAHRDLDAFFTRAPASAAQFSTRDDYQHEQFSQELRLSGSAGSLDYVLGGFYMSEEGENVGQVDVGVAPAGWPRLIGNGLVKNKNYAIFAETTFNFSDSTRLITGIRYTDESKKASFVSETIPGLTRGTTASDPKTDFLAFSGLQPLDFSETTYRIIGQHNFNEEIMGYASYSTGFKSGGFQPRLVGGSAGQFTTPDFFLPEYVDSLEVGVKTDFENVRLNFAAFSSAYEDLHVSGAPAGQIATETFNGGEASIDGVELELTWIPSSALLVDVSLGLLDAKYDRIDGSNTEITVNDELIRTPDYSISVGASYSWALSSGASVVSRLDVTSKGETHFEPNNSIASYEDGYTNVDFNIAYTFPSETWTARFGVNNLTDETYLVAGDANAALGYDLGVFARSRNYYVSLSADF